MTIDTENAIANIELLIEAIETGDADLEGSLAHFLTEACDEGHLSPEVADLIGQACEEDDADAATVLLRDALRKARNANT